MMMMMMMVKENYFFATQTNIKWESLVIREIDESSDTQSSQKILY